MPVALTYPGVYIEEERSNVHPITGVATSITAFVGRALRGPTDHPGRVQSFADFDRVYGGLWVESTLGYAVQQFFANGGSDALIVRAHKGATVAEIDLGPSLKLKAAAAGAWGNKLLVRVDYETKDKSDVALFNLFVRDEGTRTVETFRNVSIDPKSPRFVSHVLEQQSSLVRVFTSPPLLRPADNLAAAPGVDPFTAGSYAVSAIGGDGSDIGDDEVATGPTLEKDEQGIYMLKKADLFNLLCLPPPTRELSFNKSTWDNAIAYARGRRAFVIVDAPTIWNVPKEFKAANVTQDLTRADNAAVYYPQVLLADPLKENRLEVFAPCGIVAGIYARTDTQRGVWKAPAGIEATMNGVFSLSIKGQPATIDDAENGILNPLAVNCLRSFPVAGNVVWGARTLVGADALASEWKYVPVRRLAFFIEESLYRGTQWVVFEPNDEPLWAQIRLNVGAFMQTLFRQGAFQGTSPKDAYFVKCNGETTTQADIDNGIVNILVGFAPLKPAEFVVIKIQQIAPEA